MSVVPEVEARALAAPSRRAILAQLAKTDAAVSVAELTGRLGLNRDAYRDLAVLLAETLATGDDPAAVGRAAARGGDRVPSDVPGQLDALVAQLAADGFEPTVRRRGRRIEVVLARCPFADAAVANPAAVCQLHLGLAEGAADRIGGLHVDGLAPRDPYRGGCLLAVTELTGDPTDV